MGKAENFLKEILKEKEKFWSEEYPSMSRQEKVTYWLASTHKGMRTQGEAFADEYSEFSKEWYEKSKALEPDFDSIFKEAVKNIGFEFDWQEYQKRISKPWYLEPKA